MALDLFGLPARPAEAEQEVVGVAHVAQSPVVRVVAVLGGDAVHPFAQFARLLPFPRSRELPRPGLDRGVFGVVFPLCLAVVGRKQRLLDEVVQPIQVDVGEYGAHHSPLRGPAQGTVEPPVLQVHGLQEVRDQPKEAAVVDLLLKDREEYLVIQTAERAINSIPTSITHTRGHMSMRLRSPIRPIRSLAAASRSSPSTILSVR